MRCRELFVLVLPLLLLIARANAADSIEASGGFDAANRLYEQGKFREAAAAYTNLLRSGRVSAALYYNLGNACFKGGEVGRAIAAYRQAEQVTPRDPDLRANLTFARNQIQGMTVAPGWRQRSLGKLSVNEWTWATAAAVWACFGLLILQQVRPALKSALRNYVIAAAAVTLFLCVCLGASLNERLKPGAIVVTPEAVARQGPLEESQTAFVLHDGAELRVLDQKDEWLQVSTDPRRIGWVRRDQVVLAPRG